jgi:hypothetical protein
VNIAMSMSLSAPTNGNPNFAVPLCRVQRNAMHQASHTHKHPKSTRQTNYQQKPAGLDNYMKRLVTNNEKNAQVPMHLRGRRRREPSYTTNSLSSAMPSRVGGHFSAHRQVDPVLVNRVVIRTLCCQDVDQILVDNDEDGENTETDAHEQTRRPTTTTGIVAKNMSAGDSSATRTGSLSMYFSSKIEHVRSKSAALALQRREGRLSIDPLDFVGEMLREVRLSRANCVTSKTGANVEDAAVVPLDYLPNVPPAPTDAQSRTQLQVAQTRMLLERADALLHLGVN